MKKTVIIILIFTALFMNGQTNLKSNVRDYSQKIDSVPFLKYELQELDTFINLSKNMPSTAEVYGIYCKINFTFKVDAKGSVTNFKSFKVDFDYPKSLVVKNENDLTEMKLHFIKDAERIIKSTSTLWMSDSIREKHNLVYSIKYVSEAYDRIDKEVEDGGLNVGLKLGNLTGLQSKRALYNFGVKKMNSNRPLLARIYFMQGVYFFPKDIDAYYNLGASNYKLKRVDEACASWKKCLELGDNTVTAELDKYCK